FGRHRRIPERPADHSRGPARHCFHGPGLRPARDRLPVTRGAAVSAVGGKSGSATALTTAAKLCDWWTADRLLRIERPGLASQQDKENQNLLCYRYTTG